ncbi:MAG: TetM/TetW/TetO/TetS family tetracycline resistance ribosomal protection protein, partial [Clostridia bacterium]|nr:TetM/TetW/TetO/TetS family tetracycline resistance ribosomal protection protein [Clostridia bacterium]
FAHVDAGKTTLSEAILYNTGAIRRRGSIEEKNTVMDTASIERERGITCFSGAAGFEFNNNEYYLIDTPGHTDFLPDTQRCMSALDCAVIAVSAVEGIEGNTELLWDMLCEREIPTLFFINKCDRDIAEPGRVLAELTERFGSKVQLWHSDPYLEAVAGSDEALMESYFEGCLTFDEADKKASELFMKHELCPCVCGSAMQNTGVDELLLCIDRLCNTSYSPEGEPVLRIFKIRHEKDKRIMLCHISGGEVSVRDTLPNGERISELRKFEGTKSASVQKAEAGDVVEIYGITGYKAGEAIGAGSDTPCVPGLTAKVIYPDNITSKDMLTKLQILEDEEPTLAVRYEPRTGEISVSVMGKIELEILQQRIAERFNIDVSFGDCGVIYKETLAEPTVGYGHFEPLRHYSEVHLRIEPTERGSGISFESECSLNSLASNFQHLVRTHVFEKEHRGVLTGYALTDVKIILLKGAAHEKHTEGGDFREATYRAIRHGLMRGSSLLLEPYYRCRFTVDTTHMGRVISDITRLSGTLLSSETEGQRAVINARIPISEFTPYQTEFISFTGGRGRVSFTHDGYDVCHNEAEVLERIGYEPERDIENTPDSVFCAHGAGFNVPWRDVENFIHLK